MLPIVHEVIPVNMNTLRLEVSRGRDKAIITKDRMRVDVTSEFYVRVQASPDAIAAAAQTLGQRTMQPDMLKELVEGKFVDALRTVAAEMTMEELHEKRGDYVKRVRGVVAADLLQNGLELETVSLTQLDQTAMEFFNPSQRLRRRGPDAPHRAIETRKKKRNDIEQDTMIQIRNKNLDTERQALDIDRELEYARLAQERELEVKRAAQRADVARERAHERAGGRARADHRARGGGARAHRLGARGGGGAHRPRARHRGAGDRAPPGDRARRAAARHRGRRAVEGAVRGAGRGRPGARQGGLRGGEGVHRARDRDGRAAQTISARRMRARALRSPGAKRRRERRARVRAERCRRRRSRWRRSATRSRPRA